MMTSDAASAQSALDQLRRWLLKNARGLTEETLDETTPLLAGRHLTSLQVPELLLFIESLRREPIDVSNLGEGDLKDMRTIRERFLSGVRQ